MNILSDSINVTAYLAF